MRIIEWAIENKREELALKGLEVSDDVWVTIPERFFMDWLYGTVQSETTLKDAIKSLVKKHLIFKQPSGPGRYDAMSYTLNKPLISKLFSLFPEKLDDVDMVSIMKQPRKSKDSEDQKLTPSKIDPLTKRIREAKIDPLCRQLLTPSAPIIDPLVERGGGQKLTPRKKEEEFEKERKKEGESLTHSFNLSSLSTEELIAELNRRKEEQSTPGIPSQCPQSFQEDSLTPEERRIHSYWQELGFEANITPKLKGHWSKLTKHIQTFEQFKSLYEYTRQQIENDQKIKNKHVNPGNLTNDNNLNGWKQRQTPLEQIEQPKSSKPYVRNLAEDYQKMMEEILASSSRK